MEGDNQIFIDSLRKLWKVPWKIDHLVCDAGVDLHHIGEVAFSHCYQEANQVADFLAHKGDSCHSLHHWCDLLDLCFLSIIRKDALG